MHPSCRSCAVLVVLIVLLSWPQSVRAEKVDETLFLVHALEDLYRTTWPAERREVTSSQQIKQFVVARRVLADQMRRQAEAPKQDEELVDCYKEYLKLLQKGETLVKQVEAREDRYYAFFRKLRQEVLAANMLSRAETTIRTLDSASDAIASSFRNPFNDGFDALASGLFAGLAASVTGQVRHQLRMTAKIQEAQVRAARYEASNRPAFLRDLDKIGKDFFRTFDQERSYSVLRVRNKLSEVATRHGWTAAEALFDPTRPLAAWSEDGQGRNPFRVKARVLEEKRDESDPKVMLALARECQDALKLIPSSNTPCSRWYQSEFLAMAGLLANQAARLEIGQAGFKDALAHPAQAAIVAQQAWQRYAGLEKKSTGGSGVTLHQRLLAYAYGGKLREAHALLERTPVQQVPCGNPLFWYDVARLFSLVGDKIRLRIQKAPALRNNQLIQAQLKHCRDQTIYCLKMAVATGFKDLEEVNANPDLEWTRAVCGDLRALLAPRDR